MRDLGRSLIRTRAREGSDQTCEGGTGGDRMRSVVPPCSRMIARQRLEITRGVAVQGIMFLTDLRLLQLAQPLTEGRPQRFRIEAPFFRISEQLGFPLVNRVALVFQ